MKRHHIKMAIFSALFAFLALNAFAVDQPSSKSDPGNVLKRKKLGITETEPLTQEELKKVYDETLSVYLDSVKAVYKPGEYPEIMVYIKNDSKETRYFKRMWSAGGAGGAWLKIYVDGVESWGAGVFKRESVEPESDNPANALKLGPGERKAVLKVTFLRLDTGRKVVSAEYEAKYKVAESAPKNWWNGIAKSNSISLVATRELPEKEIVAEYGKVIKAIHSDVLAIKGKYKELSGYGEGSLKKTAQYAIPGVHVVEHRTPAPKKFEFRVYFNKSDYQPSTLPMLKEGFPFFGVSLFAHVDTGDNTKLRGALLDIVRKRGRALQEVVKKNERSLRVEALPFETAVALDLDRAPVIIRGHIKSVTIDEPGRAEHELRKWILDVDVKKVYKGKLVEKKIKVRCGTLTTMFGDESVKDREFILLLLDKSTWNKDYTLIGSQKPTENLVEWLGQKYSSEKK